MKKHPDDERILNGPWQRRAHRTIGGRWGFRAWLATHLMGWALAIDTLTVFDLSLGLSEIYLEHARRERVKAKA